jgi:hypothetical protein
MPIRVRAADGSIHQFPDGTNPHVINNTLSRYNASLGGDSLALQPQPAGQYNASNGGYPTAPQMRQPLAPVYVTPARSNPRSTGEQRAVADASDDVPNLDPQQYALPVVGPVEQAIADYQNRRYGQAALNAVTAASDILPFRAIANGISGNSSSAAYGLGERLAQRPAHADTLQSMVPVAGPTMEATADGENKDYIGAGLNTAAALSDLWPARDVAKTLSRGLLGSRTTSIGALKLGGSFEWDNVADWLRRRGFDGEVLHHWLLEQNQGLGRFAPKFFKNQTWNLMPMTQAEHRALGNIRPGILRPFFAHPDWVEPALMSTAVRLEDLSDENHDDDPGASGHW